MRNEKVLVVYYSRTGTTRLVAEAISSALGCDLEEIVDTRNRFGVLGYLRAASDATFRRLTTLKPTKHDPSQYDLVIVGTPVWSSSLSAPVRTYLTTYRHQLRNVAFFCTYGGTGSRRVFRQMTELCGRQPSGVFGVREGEVKRGDHTRRVRSFVAGIISARAAA